MMPSPAVIWCQLNEESLVGVHRNESHHWCLSAHTGVSGKTEKPGPLCESTALPEKRQLGLRRELEEPAVVQTALESWP